MNNNIFSGLEKLGFNDIVNVDLYNSEKIQDEVVADENTDDVTTNYKFLYDKEVICPICGTKFKVKAVKTSAYKMISKDTDFFIRYDFVSPYFYDVWLCNKCGYSAMKIDFLKIKSSKIDLIKENVSKKWQPREYPDIYDVEIAIERYKLALLNYYITDALPSKKAMTCLKIAWMYRLKEDSTNELAFLNNALMGIKEAFFKEDFPIYGMDRYTTMYLIAELSKRLKYNEEALLWFSKVITQPGVKTKLKELARDQRDDLKLSKSSQDKLSLDKNVTNETSNEDKNGKKGFLSKLFNKKS